MHDMHNGEGALFDQILGLMVGLQELANIV